MFNRLLPCVAAVFVLIPDAWGAPAPAAALPAGIRSTLTQEYPGWKLAAHPRSLVAADFDGDGKKDYAVQIALTQPGEEEQIIMIFLHRGERFEEMIVQSQGLDPDVYLSADQKMTGEPGPDGQERLIQKNVLQVLGSPIGDTAYAYQNGRFQEYK